jgi:hypothetical protein
MMESWSLHIMSNSGVSIRILKAFRFKLVLID